LPQTDINSILRFADRQCRFMDAFTHRLGRFGKQSPDKSVLSACVAGWGTNTGLHRMGQISDIGYNVLASTSDDFLRLETLREANDLSCNATAALPIFHHYDIGGVIHASCDGQKFETAFRSFNSRYSPKYWGLKKGIVRDTMAVNHGPVNARVISADDHESHFCLRSHLQQHHGRSAEHPLRGRAWHQSRQRRAALCVQQAVRSAL
jgi:hypothetical protein